MHVEIRKRGKRKLYYLGHSFRDNGKVRKVRRYLGADLTEDKIKELRKATEKFMLEQIKHYRRISDPLNTVLSSREVGMLKTLTAKGDVKIKHLSEQDWLRFAEAFTYDTNAIEGSTVTPEEVRDIIEKDTWPTNRSREEISETYGLAEAVKYIRETRDRLSLNLIRQLHEMVFKNSKSFAGKLRGRGVEVVVADAWGNILHRGAPQKQVASLLKELVGWYENNKRKYHPIALAAVVHNQFQNIHPFQDGNGRVGRLLLNNVLLKHRMPPVNIELKNRREYYSAIVAYREGNIRPTIELILKEYRELKRLLKCV
jgi:Fic family protein